MSPARTLREQCIRTIVLAIALTLNACGEDGSDSATELDDGGGGGGSSGCFSWTVCIIGSFGQPQGCFRYNVCFSGSRDPTPADNRLLCLLECPTNLAGSIDRACVSKCDALDPDIIPPTTTASPAGGTYGSPQLISFDAKDNRYAPNCAFGPVTFYTTDGSTPNMDSPRVPDPVALIRGIHTDPFLTEDTVLRFLSRDCAGNLEANVNEEIYFISDPITGEPLAVVEVHLFAFEPSDIVVTGGATVTWRWLLNTSDGLHNVTFASDSIANSDTQHSGTYSVAMPNTPGVYEYECTTHPFHNGTVTVQ